MLESIPLWIVTQRQSADYCIVICDDSDGVWQNVQIYMYAAIAPIPISRLQENPRSPSERILSRSYVRRMSGRQLLHCVLSFSAYRQKASGCRRYRAECD